MSRTKQLLESLSHQLLDPCNELLVLAQDEGEETLIAVAETVTAVVDLFQKTAAEIVNRDLLTEERLEEMAELATAFAASGDPMLEKQAAVLDEILLTIGANKADVAYQKSAQDRAVEALKDPYRKVKVEQDKDNHAEEANRMISEAVKEYRISDQPLMTRVCIDHPGTPLVREADGISYCPIDRKRYNFQTGYTTMKGNVVPGGSVENQTRMLGDISHEATTFESRESRLNRF